MKNKKKVETESGYVSNATIDNPPPPADDFEDEEFEDNQTEIPGAEKPKQTKGGGQQIDFKCDLSLKSGHKIPITRGGCPADMMEEALQIGFRSTEFRNQLRAVIGQPLNLKLVESRTSTEREEVLSGVIKTAMAGLLDIGRIVPTKIGEKSAQVCQIALDEISASLERTKEAIKTQLSENGEDKF